MRVVYKYPIWPGSPAVVDIPAGAEIVHVGEQNSQPVLWALVDDAAPPEPREFWVYGTGHPISQPDQLVHLGTVQVPPNAYLLQELVWHVFEKPRG